ncbi:MAG: hypothetical protein N3B18_04855, partial [Desulfobacterota bacterium]|nr:hypothetical protein [Thermodesulfobacteriota bacterium]
WSIAGICFALTSWTQYRICAEQGKETPDPTVLERLQNDLTTMGIGTLIAAGSGTVFRAGCAESFFNFKFLNRKRKK